MRPETADALAAVGITEAFPIQEQVLPVAMSGSDVIGQAKTGTGKTLGFGLPLLERIVSPTEPGFRELTDPGKPQALVVVPTRELAHQVARDLAARRQAPRRPRPGRLRRPRYEPQVEALRRGIEVVVGTPGRLLDLEQRGDLSLGHVRTLVLDEADEMLDLGFLPDVERIVARVPAGRQTMLFSATMRGRGHQPRPPLHGPLRSHIRATDPDDDMQTVQSVEQHVFRAHAMDKVEMLARILQAEGRGLTMVFCRTKRTAQKVADELTERGFAAGAVHGDLGQGAREQALRAFRNGKVDVLVATDVAARGIDVEDVTHVVNFQCPEDEKTYLHRVGRTGRAGKSGIGGHLRRLGRRAPVDLDQQGAGAAVRRSGRDVLDLRAPVRRARHPARDARASCRGRPGPGPVWPPSRSRTWARPARRAPARRLRGPGARPVSDARRSPTPPAPRNPASQPRAPSRTDSVGALGEPRRRRAADPRRSAPLCA